MKKYLSSIGFRGFLSLFVVCLTFLVFLNDSEKASSQQAGNGDRKKISAVSSRVSGFGISKPVRDLPEVRDANWVIDEESAARARIKGLKKEEKLKNPFNAKTIKNLVPGAGAGKSNFPFIDEALSSAPTVPTVLPTPGISFDGLSSQDNVNVFGATFAPPDTVGDVGPNHYVQMVNTLVRIFNKDGTPATAPFRLSSLTSVAGGPCANRDDGDPIVNYDPLADRWILSQFCSEVIPGHQIFAVSTTSDPTGTYYVYDFVNPNNDFFDYPKVGVWPNGYYMSVNKFNQAGTAFLGSGAFAYDRVKMLQGDPTASFIYFDLFTGICPSCSGQLPTDLDGTVTPPEGMGNLFMEFRADEFGDPFDGLRVFEFRADFANPASSTLVQVGNDVALLPFDARQPTGRNDIEQPGVTVTLDSLADRVLHRLAYRNLGSTASPTNSWVVNFSVNVGGVTPSNAATFQSGIRWAELRRVGTTGPLTVNNQATQATNPNTPAGGTNLWMGSISQDNAGNIVLGYSTSGSGATDFPSIRYAGRLAGDSANMLQAEVDGFLGTGFQGGVVSRWGDYSAMSVDPVDECSFWYTQEYRSAANNGNAFRWTTRVIGGIKFPSCTAPARGSVSGTITSCASTLPVSNAVVTLPGGFLATTNASGQYTIINVPVGTTSASATRPGFSLETAGGVTVADGAAATADLCLTGFPLLTAGEVSITAESCLPANGRVDPGETVTVSLPVSNIGGANAANDVGTLLPTGGVTDPSTAQTYGPLIAGGAPVSRSFTFTASPELFCGADLTLTVAHQDGPDDLGNEVYTVPTGTAGNSPATTSYTGPPVSVPDNSLIGSNIILPVSGIAGAVSDLDFRLDSLAGCDAAIGNTNASMTHTFNGDLRFRLISPAGTSIALITNRGGGGNNFCTVVLDDDGGFPPVSSIPAAGGVTGTFGPETPLSAFDGENPNGNWILNVADVGAVDLGTLNRFSLIITPRICCAALAPGVGVSGRVFTPGGLTIRNALVSISDSSGVVQTARTSSFGVYNFTNIPAGQTYEITVANKRFRFTARTLQVSDNLANIDFIGLE